MQICMQPIATDVAWSVRVFHCVEHNREHHKRAKPIEVPFRIWVDPKNHVLGDEGAGGSPGEYPFFRWEGRLGDRGADSEAKWSIFRGGRCDAAFHKNSSTTCRSL